MRHSRKNPQVADDDFDRQYEFEPDNSVDDDDQKVVDLEHAIFYLQIDLESGQLWQSGPRLRTLIAAASALLKAP